jgi:hypothetical protein
MVYLMSTANADAPLHRRAAAKLLLECFRIYATEDEVRECLDMTARAMPQVAEEARAIAFEAGLQLS